MTQLERGRIYADSSSQVYLPSLRTVQRLKKIINRVAILAENESDPEKTRNSTVR